MFHEADHLAFAAGFPPFLAWAPADFGAGAPVDVEDSEEDLASAFAEAPVLEASLAPLLLSVSVALASAGASVAGG